MVYKTIIHIIWCITVHVSPCPCPCSCPIAFSIGDSIAKSGRLHPRNSLYHCCFQCYKKSIALFSGKLKYKKVASGKKLQFASWTRFSLLIHIHQLLLIQAFTSAFANTKIQTIALYFRSKDKKGQVSN